MPLTEVVAVIKGTLMIEEAARRLMDRTDQDPPPLGYRGGLPKAQPGVDAEMTCARQTLRETDATAATAFKGESVKRRVLGLLAAAFSMVLITTTPASAHSTNDWVKTTQGAPAGWAHRTAKSYVGGVEQETDIYWQANGEVWVHSKVWDRKTDGYCAAVQIRYEISESPGHWAGHWHYRPVGGALDCAYLESLPQHSANWMARHGTRKVAARACHANSRGEIVECEGTWH